MTVDAETQETADAIPLVTLAYARRQQAFVERINHLTTAYITPSTPVTSLFECQRVGGSDLHIHTVSEDEFSEHINQFFERYGSKAKAIADEISAQSDASIEDVVKTTQDLLSRSDEVAPVVRLINAVLVDAIRQGASDIHIETYGNYFSIRYRIDGILQDVAKPNRNLANALISRIKIMASLDIAESRVPQDGSISTSLSQRDIDIRVATLPTRYGERAVLRLLHRDDVEVSLSTIGVSEEQKERFSRCLERPQGLILVTGPTGSGKSSTLYAGLRQIDHQSKNILTVEDPIEYELEGVGQTQVNVKAGITFASALRAMLRQDPDVVMVGEIRDSETAQTAIQAGLTGHLVLSTLHTNTAIGAIHRMVDMGIEPFLLSSTVELLVSQRLVRRLCNNCRVERNANPSEIELLEDQGIDVSSLWSAKGCDACTQSGYRGRLGIFEFIEVTDELRYKIHAFDSEAAMLEALGPEHKTMLQDGLAKAVMGVTTLEEVMRVTHS